MIQDREIPNPEFQQQVQRLHQLSVSSRWLLVMASWLTLGVLAIWGLREEIELWREYFTWSAVRFGLAYNRLSAIALGFCVGLTTAVLLWQSRNILFGLPPKEKYRLEQQVRRIREEGSSHPLWKWVCKQ